MSMLGQKRQELARTRERLNAFVDGLQPPLLPISQVQVVHGGSTTMAAKGGAGVLNILLDAGVSHCVRTP
jgi:hypothetical protein